jgi:hypothetical protein
MSYTYYYYAFLKKYCAIEKSTLTSSLRAQYLRFYHEYLRDILSRQKNLYRTQFRQSYRETARRVHVYNSKHLNVFNANTRKECLGSYP